MTTEQMDTTDARRKRDAVATPIVLYGTPSIEELAAARGRAGSRGVLVVPEEMRNEGLLVAAGSGWRSEHPIEEDGEHAHYTREGRDRCAAGDHEAAELFDRQAEAEKIAADEKHADSADCWCDPVVEHVESEGDDEPKRAVNVEVSMAEEPIEQRLLRAFLNGFREGAERASWSGGNWDHR